MNANSSPQIPERRESLRNRLLATVDLLDRCRAAEIEEGYIDDYVELNWLEWNGGALRLTTTGENVRKQMTLKLNGTFAENVIRPATEGLKNASVRILKPFPDL
jgi:hypothetical protein